MKSFFIFLLLFSFPSYSRPIDINVIDYGWITSFPLIRDTLDFYIQGVEDDINEEQPVLDPMRVNYGTANSSVLASKGLGTDYSNDPERYQISVAIGAAWDEERDVALKDEISGAAGAASVAVGIRLDHLTDRMILGASPRRFMVFANLGELNFTRDLPGRDIDIAGDIEVQNLGLHVRYDLIQKSGTDYWGWGGVKLHTGYELNRNEVDLSSTIDEPISLDTGGQGTIEGRLRGEPTFEIETVTHSFPLEVSTSWFFLNIFNLYGGFGADLNLGESKGTGDTKGALTTLACTSGICTGETVLPQVEIQANYEAQAQVRNVTFRTFLGLQLDLPLGLHAFAQGEKMLGTEVIGVSTGLKYTY